MMTTPHSVLSKFVGCLLISVAATSLLGCLEEFDNIDRDSGYVADTNNIADTSNDVGITEDTTTPNDTGDTQKTCSLQCTDNQACFDGQCITPPAMALGSKHTCLLLPNNHIQCWGDNNLAQLGLGYADAELYPTPNSVSGSFSGVLSGIYADTYQTCVKSTVPPETFIDDQVSCWGPHHAIPDTGHQKTPAKLPELVPDVSVTNFQINQLALGVSHSCALYNDGRVRCWGTSSDGQLGSAPTDGKASLTPVNILDLPPATQITAGSNFTCALTGRDNNYAVYCWGKNSYNSLGQLADLTGSATPLPVHKLTNVHAIQTGAHHTCVILKDAQKSIKCWGRNDDGQLGTGTWEPTKTPTAPNEGLSGVKQLALGLNFTCALLDSGHVTCTGSNRNGQLARPNSDQSEKYNTFQVIPDFNNVHRIFAGTHHACAIHDNNEISCWGTNEFGQGGSERPAKLFKPTKVIF